MKNLETLSDLRNHLYDGAEAKWNWTLRISVAALVASIIGTASANAVALTITGLASIAFPVVISWIRELASTEILHADKCRRLVLYSDGLGHTVAAAELAEVNSWGLGSQIQPAPFSGSYYQSTHSPGPRRLADITTESAYFTKFLAGKVQVWLWWIFAVSIAVVIGTLSLAELAKSAAPTDLVIAAKAIGIFVAFLVSSDVALPAKKFGDLSKAADLAFRQGDQLRRLPEPDVEFVRTIVDDYGTASLQCPPIPSWLFLKYQAALNAAYQGSHSSG